MPNEDGCGHPGATEEPCPYEEEINDDHESTCFCCEDCRQHCAEQI